MVLLDVAWDQFALTSKVIGYVLPVDGDNRLTQAFTTESQFLCRRRFM